MSKTNVVLRSFYVNDDEYRLFTRAKGTRVIVRGANYSEGRYFTQDRDVIIAEWGACPDWGQECSAEWWPDTPTNRKKAYAYFEQKIHDRGWNRK